MNNPLESNIKQLATVYAEQNDAFTIHLTDLNRIGAPDRMYVTKKGQVIFVEFKRKGEDLRFSQKIYHRLLTEKYQEVWLIDDINEFYVRFDNL